MSKRQQLFTIVIPICLILLQTPSTGAATRVDDCPTNLAQEAEQRLIQIENTRQHLVDFLSGGTVSETPLSALFVVDLKNETAVQNRIRELQILQTQKRASINLTDAYVNCTKSVFSLKMLAEKVEVQQLALDKLRLEFLILPQDRRLSLINNYIDRQKQASTVAVLAEERSAADKLQNEAAISGATAEQLAKNAASLDLREIAAQRALLEKNREMLGHLQADMLSQLQASARFYQQTSEKLSALAAVTAKRDAGKSLLDAYWETVSIWRDLVDRVFQRIGMPANLEPVPDLPKPPTDLLTRLKNTEAAAQYLSVYQETEALKSLLETTRLQRFEKERTDLYRLLLDAGHLRSALLKLNLDAGNEQILKVTTDYFLDIGREMRIVPYQVLAIFYSKALDFRQMASSGVSGWLDIAKQSLIFLLFVAVLFGAFTGLNRVSNHLDRLRNHLVREKINHAYARTLALWIRRVNAYVPWVIMLLGVYIAQDLVAGTDIAQIGLFLPYIAYYLWYRVFLNFTFSMIGRVAFSGVIDSTRSEKDRLQRTVRLVGIFFFVLLAILHATKDAVGEALVYRLVYDFVVYVGLLVCAYAAREWRREIVKAAEQLLPEHVYRAIHALSSNMFWSWFVSLPALFLVIFTKFSIYIKHRAGEFDFFKRISAAIFLRRIEHATKASGKSAVKQPPQLPEEYQHWFKLEADNDKSLLIEPESGIVTDVEVALSAWFDNSSLDHSLALFGEKGSGKSCLLDMVELRFHKCQVRRIDIPPKLTTRESVLDFFGKELGKDLSQGDESLLQADTVMSDTVLLIDDAQNLFLGELGGFEGYRAFAELMNSGTDHLFWCVTFNLRSWHYLRAVFGGMPLFRRAIEINDFSEKDIMSLVMVRHRRTDAHLAYDEIIRATQSEEDYIGEHHVEKQFFRLLWGQSNGNPRAALMLWTTSLHQLPNNRLKVGLPKYPKVTISEDWGDEALFVYAAIMRHENLNIKEVISVTSLPENIVINALGTGYDNNLLSCGVNGRYRITPIAQFSLTQLLLRKNFIYE